MMRFLATCAVALCFALPAWALDLPKGFEKIGEFAIEMGGESLELISTSSEESGHSDLYLTSYADETQHIIYAYTVQAASGLDANGQAVPPILSVEFDQDPETGALTPARVILVGQDWDTALATYPEQTYREIEVDNLVFTKDGVISFDVSADLIRLNWDQYMPIPDAPTIIIQGRYSGRFSAFALDYQQFFGDQ